jgi:hypothetical protein
MVNQDRPKFKGDPRHLLSTSLHEADRVSADAEQAIKQAIIERGM